MAKNEAAKFPPDLELQYTVLLPPSTFSEIGTASNFGSWGGKRRKRMTRRTRRKRMTRRTWRRRMRWKGKSKRKTTKRMSMRRRRKMGWREGSRRCEVGGEEREEGEKGEE